MTLDPRLRVSSVEDFVARFTSKTGIPVVETAAEPLSRLWGGREDLHGIFFDAPMLIRVRKWADCECIGSFYAVLLHEIGHATAVVAGLGRPTAKTKAADEEMIADAFAVALMARFGLVVPAWFVESMESSRRCVRASGRVSRAVEAAERLADKTWRLVYDE